MDPNAPQAQEIVSPPELPNRNNRKLLFIIGLFFVTSLASSGFLFFLMKGLNSGSSNVESNNSITYYPSPTVEDIGRDTEITPTFAIEPVSEILSYKLPSGWVEDNSLTNYPRSDSASFRSSDVRLPVTITSFTQGAMIYVIREEKDPKKTLREHVNTVLRQYENKFYDYPKVQIANLEGLNAFYCWEGCTDSYFVEKNGFIWRFDFVCRPDCSTKNQTNMNPHSLERDHFLHSVKLY